MAFCHAWYVGRQSRKQGDHSNHAAIRSLFKWIILDSDGGYGFYDTCPQTTLGYNWSTHGSIRAFLSVDGRATSRYIRPWTVISLFREIVAPTLPLLWILLADVPYFELCDGDTPELIFYPSATGFVEPFARLHWSLWGRRGSPSRCRSTCWAHTLCGFVSLTRRKSWAGSEWPPCFPSVRREKTVPLAEGSNGTGEFDTPTVKIEEACGGGQII